MSIDQSRRYSTNTTDRRLGDIEECGDCQKVISSGMLRVMASRDINSGSEFGGVPGLVQPVPHVPTASEKLSLIYRTGDPSGVTGPRPDVFAGLREEGAQRAVREAEGALAKGQTAEELLTAAQGEISALQAEAAPD